jgi:hypothetical protein
LLQAILAALTAQMIGGEHLSRWDVLHLTEQRAPVTADDSLVQAVCVIALP